MDRLRVYRIEMDTGRVRYDSLVLEFGLEKNGILGGAGMQLDRAGGGSKGGM
jgi:hypothetical protein